MKRKIIQIDEKKCTGCGLCIPNCPEGAIQIIDGKARLISDLFCDGLGACLGHCPEGAITVIEREAEAYKEKEVMGNVVQQGANVISAHLQHLHSHGEKEYLKQAIEYLKEKNIDIPDGPWKIPSNHQCQLNQPQHAEHHHAGGCPGSKAMSFTPNKVISSEQGSIPSQLRQWPVQLHLISPHAKYFQGQDLLVAADCTAYSLGNFHQHLQGKSLIIACPKLDDGQDIYLEKLIALIDDAQVSSITVMIMEVPCCRGLLNLVSEAATQATRKVPIRYVIVGIQGNIIKQEELPIPK